MIPNVTVEKLKIKNGKIVVVREDLLVGGTKSRAAIPFIKKMKEYGCSQFNYASPFCGYAQIALALACKENNVKCKIFAVERNGLSEYSKIAQDHNAEIELCSTLDEAEHNASKEKGFKIPLGFNHTLYETFFFSALKKQLEIVNPKNSIWVPVGSGTLLKTIRKCTDKKLIGVNVKIIPIHIKLPNTTIIDAPERFEEQAAHPPAIPSNPYYDAKIWQFVQNYAQNDDVWWNVAR